MPSNNIIPLHRGATVHQLASARATQAGGDSPAPRPANLYDGFAEELQREPAERRSLLGGFADDWRSFVVEVRASPASHALVAVLTVIGWTLLLVLPLLIGGGL
jgi:hypothetical protein